MSETAPNRLRRILLAAATLLLAFAPLVSAQDRRLGVEPPPAQPALNAYMRLTLNGTAVSISGDDRIGFYRWSSTHRWSSTATPQTPSDFTLEKHYDGASAKLAQYCADGTHFDVAELDLAQPDGSVRTYRLRNATIASYSLVQQRAGPAKELITIHGQPD